MVFKGRLFIMCLLMQPLCCGPGAWCNALFPWSDIDPFQIALHEWLAAFNREVLHERGMFIKGFSFAQTNEQGGQWNDGSWAVLAIGLTPRKIIWLKSQPVLQQGHSGDPNWGCWCCLAHNSRAI